MRYMVIIEDNKGNQAAVHVKANNESEAITLANVEIRETPDFRGYSVKSVEK